MSRRTIRHLKTTLLSLWQLILLTVLVIFGGVVRFWIDRRGWRRQWRVNPNHCFGSDRLPSMANLSNFGEHSMEYPQSSVHSCPDWRYHLRSEVRHGIINKMVAVLTRISNRIVTDRVYNFQTVGVKLEEAAYNRANCQEEYDQRICAKLAHFWMQTIDRQANSSNRNANYVHQATRSSNQAANMNNAPHWQGVTVTSKIYLTRIRFLSETRNKNEIPNSTARKRGRKTRHGSTGWTQLRQ